MRYFVCIFLKQCLLPVPSALYLLVIMYNCVLYLQENSAPRVKGRVRDSNGRRSNLMKELRLTVWHPLTDFYSKGIDHISTWKRIAASKVMCPGWDWPVLNPNPAREIKTTYGSDYQESTGSWSWKTNSTCLFSHYIC